MIVGALIGLLDYWIVIVISFPFFLLSFFLNEAFNAIVTRGISTRGGLKDM